MNRTSWWQIAIVITIAGVMLLLVPILAWRGQFDVFSSPSFKDFVSLLAVLISWPAAVVLIALLFMKKFTGSIDTYLRSIGKIKLPGGVELQSNQGTADDGEGIPPGALVLSHEQQQQIAESIRDLEQQRNLSAEERAAIQRDFEQMAGFVIDWKFRFLNLFLVDNSKNVLHWFSANPPQTRASYDALWNAVIPDQNERCAILDALLHMGLLREQDGVVRIDPHGYSFLQFIGVIPQPPAAG